MKERWSKLINFNSAYEISDLGGLRSVHRVDISGRERKSQPIKQRISKKYYCSNIRATGKSITVRTHRLVAEMFVPNPNNYPIVNHIDGNPLNNAYWNLEWTDHMGKTIHAIQNRLTRKPGGKEKTLTENQVLTIFKSDRTTLILSHRFKVCLDTINQIRNGKKWGWLTGKKYVSKDGNRKYVEHNGEKLTYSQLAKKIGSTPATITYRLGQGWSVDKIIANTPKKKGVIRWQPNQRDSIYV